MTDIKYLTFRGTIFPIVRSKEDRLWRSADGTIIALSDDENSVEAVVRCGVGILSLSVKHKLTDACRPHDFMYSSLAYQVFNKRSDADSYLATLVEIIEPGTMGKVIGWFMSTVSHLFGGKYWEVKKTR